MTLLVELYSPEGVKLNALPLADSTVLGLQYTHALNEIGRFQLTVPATAEAAAELQIARRVWITNLGEGLVFKGIIEELSDGVPVDGKATLVVMGRSVAATLAWKTTLLGRTFSGQELSAIVDDLLTGTDFAAGTLASPSTVVSTRFDGRSIWDALRFISDTFTLSIREDARSGQVDIAEFGAPSGITFKNIAQHSVNMSDYVFPIQSIKKRRYALDLFNRIIPVGQHQGLGGATPFFDLRYSTRTSPYTVQSENDTYYIEDTASVSTYGRREKAIKVEGIQPLSLSGQAAASNTLYDTAVTHLERHKDEQSEYSVDVVGLGHLLNGAYRFQPGDTIKLEFDGQTQDADGRRTYLSVDRDLYLMAFTRTFDVSGADRWTFTLSTILRDIPNDGNRAADFMRELQAVKAAPLPYILFGVEDGEPVMRLDTTGIQMAGGFGAITALWFLNEFTSEGPSATGLYSAIIGSAIPDNGGEPQTNIRMHAESSTGTEASSMRAAAEANGIGTPFFHLQGYTDLGGGVTGNMYFKYDVDKGRFVLELDGNSVGNMELLIKEADETINNIDTLQSDAELAFAVAANENIQFEGILSVSGASATADFRMTFIGPAGSTGSFTVDGGFGGAQGSDHLGDTIHIDQIFTITNYRFWGAVVNGATAGNLQLWWAQGTATVSDLTVRAGSYIKWQSQ